MVSELSKSDRKALLEEARDRFDYVCENDSTNRKWQREDTRFVYEPGAQWSKEIRDERKRIGDTDPCLEFNQLKQFVNQVINDQRQNRPGIRVHPADGEASEEVAEVKQGLVRAIEYDSQAEAVYDAGYQHSVVGGRGYWRVLTEYESGKSFDQKLVIKRIPDPLSVYPDIDFQMPDASDMNFCFVIEALDMSDFKRKYPKAKPSSWNKEGDYARWFDGKDKVIVADYYRRVAVDRALVMLPDGTTMWEDELPEELKNAKLPKRPSEDYRVEWYTIAGGNEVLERHEWLGTLIPVVMDMGDEVVVEGKRMFQGLIRQARDPQSFFNFAMSQQALHLAIQPRAPWIMAEGQAEGYETLFRDSNRVSHGYLYYKPVTVDGQLAPPPQRQQPSMPDAGWANMSQQLTGLLRSTIGMYQNNLGMQGQETSGKAIMAREQQGDNATFHYADNHARAIALTGRIIVELIPHYYDTQRTVHIIGEDDVRKLVTLNEQKIGADPTAPPMLLNDVTAGKYAVTVSSGPTYATKRQEGADLLMKIVQAVPDTMKVAGDLVVKAQEIPDADILAERFKLLLPPQIQQSIAQDEQDGEIVVPPAIRSQMAQMQVALQQCQQQLQQAMQQNAELQDDNRTTILKAAMDNATKILIDLNQPQQVDPMTGMPMASRPDAGAMMAELPNVMSQVVAAGQGLASSMGGVPSMGPAPLISPQQRPNPLDALPQMMEQVLQMGQQLAAAFAAPRTVTLQTDAMGNPIGAVSAPAETIQ